MRKQRFIPYTKRYHGAICSRCRKPRAYGSSRCGQCELRESVATRVLEKQGTRKKPSAIPRRARVETPIVSNEDFMEILGR